MMTTTALLATILGQKQQLDALRPFNTTQLKNLRAWFRIGFIQNSNAIEGNSSSLSEVKVLLEDGITVGGKTVKEIKETLNHGDVMQSLDNLFTEKHIEITQALVLGLHSDLMRGLVEKTVPSLMDSFFVSDFCKPQSLEDVARLHFEFVNVHPFVDGNGRIARLLMNIGLISIGYFPIIIIPAVLRNDYISSLQGKDFQKWFDFFLRQVYENHKDYIRFFSNV